MGLGDILWEQAIVDHFIDDGHEVIFPVDDTYYEMVSSSIIKPGLSWCRTNDEFPLKYVYQNEQPLYSNGLVYLPLRYADKYISAPLMLGKYTYAQLPAPEDYRNHFEITRNFNKEQDLIKLYNINPDTTIVNESFGPPDNPIRHSIHLETAGHVHYMSASDDINNGFCLFDWIGALQLAKAIHTVGTSVCYIIDKYCDNDMHIYERRGEGWPRTFHKEIEGVYKNPRWVYED